MCGVVAYFRSGQAPPQDKKVLSSLVEQSRIRGLHAFGVAYGFAGKPLTVRKFFKLKELLRVVQLEDYNLLIAHTRYDTSGDWRVLENNQPVVAGKDLLVFNGVVRMSLREEYEKEFKRKYVTDNDGEIVLRMLCEGSNKKVLSLLDTPQVSYAGVQYIKGKATVLRNARRPLWELRKRGEARYIVSTADIARRALTGEVAQYTITPLPELEQVRLC